MSYTTDLIPPYFICSRSLLAIVVSHSLLNLRQAASAAPHGQLNAATPSALPSLDLSDGQSAQHSTLRFASFVGPMGGTLDLGLDDDIDADASNAGDEVHDSEELEMAGAIQEGEEIGRQI